MSDHQLVRAYRSWRIDDVFNMKLLGARSAVWTGRELVASCGMDSNESEERCSEHLAANVCSCGIYGGFDKETAAAYGGRQEKFVFARCIFSGHAAIGPNGVRAEKALIEEMWVVWPNLPERGQRVIAEAMAENFAGVTYWFSHEIPDLPKLFPPMWMRPEPDKEHTDGLIKILRRLSTRSQPSRKRERTNASLPRQYTELEKRGWVTKWGEITEKGRRFLRVYDRVSKVKKRPPRSRPRHVGVVRACVCGCGGMTGGNFCPGHDARVYSRLKQAVKWGGWYEDNLPDAVKKGMPLRDAMEAKLH